MSRPLNHVRNGFHGVDLLVTAVVALVMIAVAIPAVQSSNGSGQQIACKGRMRQVAAAVLAYEVAKRQYPGYTNPLKLTNGQVFADPTTGQKRGVSWVVPVLPYLGKAALRDKWTQPGNADIARLYDNAVAALPDSQLDVLICPGDPDRLAKKCGMSFVANCGMKDWPGLLATNSSQGMPTDWPENGVFFDLFRGHPMVNARENGQPLLLPMVRISNEYISRVDGTSNTCMLSENLDAGGYTENTEAALGILWNATGQVDVNRDPPHLDPTDPEMRIVAGADKRSIGRKTSTARARPSSLHENGVNMAFCDGSVRFVRDDMDYYVYCLLMSNNGSRVRLPGSNRVLQNFIRPLVEARYIRE